MADGVKYIKISKIDKNGVDKTIVLQSLTELTIPYSTGNVRYDILDIVEKPTYFLYRVDNPNIEWADRADIEYDFTGSFTTSSVSTSFTTRGTELPISSSTTDNLSFFNSSTGNYVVNTYPQKDLLVHFSGSITTNGTTGNITLSLRAGSLTTDNPTTLSSIDISNGTTTSFHISASINPTSSILPVGGKISFRHRPEFLSDISSFTLSSDTYISITSTAASGLSINTVPEPYFSSDFNRALDCQPTLNNAVDARLSNIYQDVDYNSGIITPTNFELLISGSALKASVQDSNYTLLRHTNPRYNGSRSTSQKLNVWTEGDIGTYGKTPTAESLKTHVAFCDWIGGYPPEKMNASAGHIQYMIKDDGTILDPNTNKASLSTAQGTFIPNETVRIKWDLPGTDENRGIIRGGANINMVLYNQVKHSLDPPMTFSESITLTDKGDNGALVGDYQAVLNKSAIQTLTANTWTTITFPELFSSGSGLSSGDVVDGTSTYRINSGIISENISVTFKVPVTYYNPQSSPIGGNAVRLYNTSTSEQVGTEVYLNEDGFIDGNSFGDAELNITIPSTQLTAGHIYSVQAITTLNNMIIRPNNPSIGTGNTQFIIQQNPSPTGTFSTTGLFNRIPSAYTSSYRGVYVTSSLFISSYGAPNIKQEDIDGSGFNPIQETLEFKPGDEFRFEGDENKVFMVEKVEQGIFPFTSTTGSLMIYFNKAVPSSSAALNLDEFAVRRYVENPSFIIFEGYKPTNSNGPYLFTPEFISQDLDTDLNQYITDLTEKGLI